MDLKPNIPICVPNISGNELKNLNECIETEFVSSVGRFVDEFERNLCSLSKFQFSCAVNSGTSALSLALHNAGVKHGELVIIPDYTFIATANAVSHCGASPWLFDINPSDLNLDISLVRKSLEEECYKLDGDFYHKDSNQRIGAIIPVFALGNATNFEVINQLFNDFNIPVIIDAAGALGVKYKNLDLGELDVTCITISFNGNKTFTCGGGGAILTNHEPFFNLCKHTSTTARSGYEYIHDKVGFNHRMTNIQAAVGCAQLERYEEFISSKQDIFTHYVNNFKYLDKVSFHDDIFSSKWISYFILDDVNDFNLENLYQYAKDRGIHLRPFWVPMHLQPPYSKCPSNNLVNSKDVYLRVCTLPSSTNISKDQLNSVSEVINNFFTEIYDC